MHRREFLKNTAAVSALSTLTFNLGLGSLLTFSGCESNTHSERILVLVQLEGGNDGLNTVIPIDQYSNLYRARKNLLVPEKKILPLKGIFETGFHPSIKELQSMYNNGKLAVVQGVGFVHPDLSHFKAMDVWHTGFDQPGTISTGWLGRYLDEVARFENDELFNDPPAIQIGNTLSKIFQGSNSGRCMVVKDLDSFYELLPGKYGKVQEGSANNELVFLRRAESNASIYQHKVKAAADAQSNLSSLYPGRGKNELADQLKIVARLIGGGLSTKIYFLNIKGFDTHDEQVDSSDTTQGAHAELLSKVSVAISAFYDDLRLMGKSDNVLGMVYSEFGRRIKSNASYGCDHGTAGPVLLFGDKVVPGIIGKNPAIAAEVGIEDNLPTQFDFRSLYATVLNKWLGLPKSSLGNVLLGDYSTLNCA